MELLEGTSALRAALDNVRLAGKSLGFVPTMGALHAGHASLIDRAGLECDAVVTSIFVNPTQFNDPKDLAAYPRSLEQDLALLEAHGCDFAFVPSVEEIYPEQDQSQSPSVPAVAHRWEGEERPGHFAGVIEVVDRLLDAVGPCRLYLGEKDFQQLAVLRAHYAQTARAVEIVGCATDRESDALARSSRNLRLSKEARSAAAAIPLALDAGVSLASEGASPAAIERAMTQLLLDAGAQQVDYAVLVDATSLEPALRVEPVTPQRLLIAASFGGLRLIDNADPKHSPLHER